MKIVRITVLFALAFLLACASVVGVFAVPAPIYPGDVDLAGDVNIKDATYLQKHLAGLEDLNKAQQYCAEIDGDGKITVKDATLIQKKVAGIVEKFEKEGASDYVRAFCLYADFDSGKAMVGTPVEFFAEAYGGLAPLTYEFSIDGEVVSERSENNSFAYTFSEAGTYTIEVAMYNVFDRTVTKTMEYAVVDAYESAHPVVVGFAHNRNLKSLDEYDNITLVANAIGGFGSYEYQFVVSSEKGAITQEYSKSSECVVENLSQGVYTATVYVRDPEIPGVTAQASIPLIIDEPLIG